MLDRKLLLNPKFLCCEILRRTVNQLNGKTFEKCETPGPLDGSMLTVTSETLEPSDAFIDKIASQLAEGLRGTEKTKCFELPIPNACESAYKVTDPSSNLTLRVVSAYNIFERRMVHRFDIGLL